MSLRHLLDPRRMVRGAIERVRGDGRKKINLALQGGGAHGAFTWGVLDAILDDGRLAIDGISGSSAGAVNAVMLADELARGGRRCSARWSSGCFRSCRSKARPCRRGSTRWRGISRPTTSTRSTSIR